jgi:drug/metabolite transporter (DMT)-like permease
VTPLLTSARERKLAIIAWVTVCLVWGTTYLAIRVALETVPVALLAGIRWTTAGLLLVAGLRLLGQTLPPPRVWPALALVGFFMNVVGNGFVVWAQQYVPSGLAAVVIATVPFWAVLVEACIPRGERFTRRVLTGLTIGFAGIVVLVWPNLTMGGADGRMFIAGVIALQIACLGWALGTSYTKHRPIAGSPIAMSSMQMLFGGTMMLLLGTATGEWSNVSFSVRSGAALAYLVVAGSIVGYTSYVFALKHLPVATVSLYAYINPIIAVVLGTLVLSEPFSGRIIVAAALVFAGVAVVRSAPAHKPLNSKIAKAA